jgi:hypothetical protein
MKNAPTIAEGDAVARLFAERQKLEGWLSALETRRASTPAHIHDRVRSDYEGRLRGVLEQLREHRSTVQSMVESMEQRLAVLATEEARHQDERAEAELRSAIGELDDDSALAIIHRAEEAMSGVTTERGAILPELTRLREVLATTADSPPRPAAPAPEPVAAAAASPAAAEPQAEMSAFDELEFLKSVVDPRGRPGAVESAPAAEPVGAASHGASGPSARPASGSVPTFLRDVPTEQTKTLKCQECGTLNYPTEWYCERCGAELAAL